MARSRVLVKTQDIINQRILDQLNAIGSRLDKLEQQGGKKTSDRAKVKSTNTRGKQSKPKESTDHRSHVVAQNTSGSNTSGSVDINTLPSLHVLRNESDIQKQIEIRLRQLSDQNQGEKLKSMRGGETDIFVKRRVRWPQEFVLSGFKKERVSYDSLTMGQWVVGYCKAMQEESDIALRDCMLEYMIALMEDANDFSWQAAKASHAVLLCRMEQGEIANFSQVDKIDRIRRVHAQRHIPAAQNAQTQLKKPNARSMPCQYFNTGACAYQSSHENKGVSYKHVCANCFKKTGKSFNHPETECRKARSAPKND